ncbi:MAG: lysophospholipid acyltransferase family protein, partial [Pseudomonadota bacterium]
PIGVIYWCGGTILLTRKSAKPRFLNVFKPLFTRKSTGFDRARERLAEGASVGVYPEGTVNRRHDRLLKGYSGAARLSVETGVPIVPAGVTFPSYTGVRDIDERAPMRITFGKPLNPGPARPEPRLEEVRDWHAEIMSTIARLSGKAWNAQSTRR